MQKPLLVVLFLLLVCGGALAWLLGGGPDAGPQVPVTGPGAEATVDPELAQGDAPTPEVKPDNARVAADPTPKAADTSGPCLVGQIVDPSGAPVAGAEVSTSSVRTAALRNFDANEIDFGDVNAMRDRIRAMAADRTIAVTGDDGRFRLPSQSDAARIDLAVHARGFRVLRRGAERPTTQDVDLGTLKLDSGAVVSGRVIDERNQPVGGAVVLAMPSRMENFGIPAQFEAVGMEMMGGLGSGEDAETRADGTFELAHVAPGEFTLRAQHPDHPLARKDGLRADAGQAVGNIVVILEAGAVLSGRVTGIPAGTKAVRVVASPKPAPRNNEPRGRTGEASFDFGQLAGDLEGMLGDTFLHLAERSDEVDADGRFELRGLSTKQVYRLCAVQTGKGFTTPAVCSERIELNAGNEAVELHYNAGVTVTFRAVDRKTQQPVETMWVRDALRGDGGFGDLMQMGAQALGGGARSKSYPDGRVTLANLRPKDQQKLDITIEAIGYARTAREKLALPAGGTVDLGTIELEPRPVIDVLVLAPDGQPVAAAEVRLRVQDSSEQPLNNIIGELRLEMGAELPIPGMRGGGGGSPQRATTDAEGRCRLNAEPGKSATVGVTADRLAPYRSTPFTMAATDGTHEVRMLEGGSVVVTALDGDRKPLAEARIERRGPIDDRDSRQTRADGSVVFTNLTPGKHRFRLRESLGGATGTVGRFTAVLDRGAPGGGNQDGWQEIEVADRRESTLTLSKSLTASLSGIITQNGTPLAGARLQLVSADDGGAGGPRIDIVEGMMNRSRGSRRGGSGGNRTDDGGRYELTEQRPGDYRLQISHEDRRMPALVPVTLRDGRNQFDVDLDLAIITGVVKDPAGNPLAGADVSVAAASNEAPSGNDEMRAVMRQFQGGRGGVKTGADGRFELRGVDGSANLVVTARHDSGAPAVSAPLAVGRGGTVEVALQIAAGGSIEVAVAGSAMFAAVIATYTGTDVQGVPPVTQMVNRGSAKLNGLRPGTWQVRVRGMNNAGGEPQTVEVKVGETAKLSF